MCHIGHCWIDFKRNFISHIGCAPLQFYPNVLHFYRTTHHLRFNCDALHCITFHLPAFTFWLAHQCTNNTERRFRETERRKEAERWLNHTAMKCTIIYQTIPIRFLNWNILGVFVCLRMYVCVFALEANSWRKSINRKIVLGALYIIVIIDAFIGL